MLGMLLAVVSCQCWRVRSDPPAPPPAAAAAPTTPATEPENSKEYVLLVRFRLITIEVPVGTVSGSEALWSYLDEEKITVERSTVLGRNGLRIGAASRNHWPDIAKILTAMTGRALEETSGVILPGAPCPLTLKQAQPIQTIFVSNEDRTLSGCDYPEGDNVIALSCSLNQDDPSMIMITGVPQVRTTQRYMRVAHEGGRVSMENQPLVYSFGPLIFRLALAGKDVLVIGPGSESRRPYSLGRHFLVRQKDGVEFETVLVLIPEAIAQPTHPS
jgi:hypothetical protein